MAVNITCDNLNEQRQRNFVKKYPFKDNGRIDDDSDEGKGWD